MKRKIFSILFALVLVVSLSLVMAVPAAAGEPQVWVDDGFTEATAGWGLTRFATIQAGINAVAEDGTVNVLAGIYDSSLETFPITISKSLTLLGARANVDPRPSQGGRTGNESIIDADETSRAVIQISASNVEVNGFTITGGKGDMVEEDGSADNLLFCYNILYDDIATCNFHLAWDSADRGDEGIQIKNSSGVVMEYNYAYNICEDAFNLSDSTDGAIRYNEAHDIYSENAAIYCYGSPGLEIRGNLIYNVPNNDGIKLGDKDGSDAAIVSNSVIAQNIVHDTAQDGISVYTSGVTVEGNEVYNSSSENGAIYLALAIKDITIQNNSVHDNVLNPSVKPHVGGIGIESPVDAASVHINFNNIYNNTPYGLNNGASAGVVDATSNWWGHASGPYHLVDNPNGFGNVVSDNVTFDPWLGSFYAEPETAALTMTATFEPSIGISVEPASVSFGEVTPDVPSHRMVRVINTGTIAENFSAGIQNESHPPVYAEGLVIDNSSVDTWNPTSVLPQSYNYTHLTLTVPPEATPGTYTATLVFWAEAAE